MLKAVLDMLSTSLRLKLSDENMLLRTGSSYEIAYLSALPVIICGWGLQFFVVKEYTAIFKWKSLVIF